MDSLEKARRRDELRRACREILDKAIGEKRNLTQPEKDVFDKKMGELDQLLLGTGGTYLTRSDALAAAERQLSVSMGTIAGINAVAGATDPSTGLPLPFRAAASPDWHGKGVVTRALEHGESCRSYLEGRGGYDTELAQVRPGAILRALALGTTDELERRTLAAGIDTAGGYTVPSILAASFIDAMRAASVVSRAGARVVPLEGETSIAQVVSDPVPQWRAENQPVAESEPTFGSVTFHPRSLAVMAKASREVLEDSINIEEALMGCLSQAMGLELDRACLLGTGAANEPWGISNWPGIHEVALNSIPTYDVLLTARTALLTSNSRPPTAYILHPREEGVYSKMKDGVGLPYPVPPKIEGVPFLTTTQVPISLGTGTDSLIITGDFRRALIGMRTSLRIEVLRERYADTLTYGFLAWLRADLILEQPAAFCKITGVQKA